MSVELDRDSIAAIDNDSVLLLYEKAGCVEDRVCFDDQRAIGEWESLTQFWVQVHSAAFMERDCSKSGQKCIFCCTATMSR